MNIRASTFAGMDIIVSSLIQEFTPVLELRPTVVVTDAFRQEFNQYLLATFGQVRTVLMIGNKTLVHPNTYRLLQKEVKQNAFNTNYIR